jgi:hypothetical protein
MMDVLRRPDEVYRDIFHDNIRYFLRRVGGDYWLCVITVGSEAHTAYLIIGIGLRDGYNIPAGHRSPIAY